jgi:hypothetical protein
MTDIMVWRDPPAGFDAAAVLVTPGHSQANVSERLEDTAPDAIQGAAIRAALAVLELLATA